MKEKTLNSLRVLIIGGGGREHAIAWKVKQSSLVNSIYSMPGNAGISKIAKCYNIDINDNKALINFAIENNIHLTIVGPEVPLVNGIVDEFEKHNLRIFGPNKMAALIEGSKVFSKRLMNKYNIPTARAEIFDNPNSAIEFVRENKWARVIKADGLAAGKGVIVCSTEEEATGAINKLMVKREFGNAGDKILVEEKLGGEEVSYLVFTDGKCIKPMVSSQDYKRIYDNDKGLNTGGMGAYSPAPVITEELSGVIIKRIIKPVINALNKESINYKGVLYAGLMITEECPKVLEFNCRFGDPETQVIIPRLKTDLVKVLLAIIDERLGSINIEWDNKPAVCVVLASKGYPGAYEKGIIINGLEDAEKLALVFHAGTKQQGNDIITNGGRVIGVTALGNNIKEAIDTSYRAVKEIEFEGMHYRNDIGYKALGRRS